MKRTFSISLTKVTLLRARFKDTLLFEFAGQSAYPALEEQDPGKYPPVLQLNTAKDFGERWLWLNSIWEYEFIDADTGKREMITDGFERAQAWMETL